jgi:hypothetical protein
MNQHESQDGGGLAIAEPSYERIDAHRREIVNHGMLMQETSNTISALEYLKSHEIAPDVISRVLHDPAQRRSIQHH